MTSTLTKRPMTLGATEAKRAFSRLLKAAEKGRQITITRNGVAVAQLTGVPRPKFKSERARLRAINKMMAMMTKGIGISGPARRFTRDEMYEE